MPAGGTGCEGAVYYELGLCICETGREEKRKQDQWHFASRRAGCGETTRTVCPLALTFRCGLAGRIVVCGAAESGIQSGGRDVFRVGWLVQWVHSVLRSLACAASEMRTERARTQRALARGTAKRLAHKHAKPRPMGRVLGRCVQGL
jgi:hypothetical protein